MRFWTAALSEGVYLPIHGGQDLKVLGAVGNVGADHRMFVKFQPIRSGASIRRSSSYGGRYGSSPITVLCGRWRENPAVSVVGLRCGFLVVV
ncbi:MAG: hypothetical protein LAT55_11245, partial [Opitutales bacterium]|nr:hypothetical protein [Opitutales bacterium]